MCYHASYLSVTYPLTRQSRQHAETTSPSVRPLFLNGIRTALSRPRQKDSKRGVHACVRVYIFPRLNRVMEDNGESLDWSHRRLNPVMNCTWVPEDSTAVSSSMLVNRLADSRLLNEFVFNVYASRSSVSSNTAFHTCICSSD